MVVTTCSMPARHATLSRDLSHCPRTRGSDKIRHMTPPLKTPPTLLFGHTPHQPTEPTNPTHLGWSPASPCVRRPQRQQLQQQPQHRCRCHHHHRHQRKMRVLSRLLLGRPGCGHSGPAAWLQQCCRALLLPCVLAGGCACCCLRGPRARPPHLHQPPAAERQEADTNTCTR